jgi:hypothetical protein
MDVNYPEKIHVGSTQANIYANSEGMNENGN